MVFRKLILAILTQIPLAAGILTWRKYVVVHYVLTAVLGIIYEFSVLLIGFGKKVWAKIEDKLVQSTADWIVNAANRLAPNFRRRYYRLVVREHGTFTVSGLVLIQTSRLQLEQVFVDLRVESANPVRFNVDPIKQTEFAGSRPIWTFLQPTGGRDSGPKSLAVIGPPGSGKTTLLKHLALTLATSRERRHQTSAPIPLLLFLRDHIHPITHERPSLGNLAQGYFGNPNAFSTLKPPADWFQNQLEHGRCLVMLDGLDEVAEPQQRKAVSEWVDLQIRNYPDCKFVLTSRPQGYLDAPLELADIVLEVQPFNAEQVKRFVENWYLASEVMSSKGEAYSSVHQRAEEGAKNLLQRLRDVPSLSALTLNPLLLTMIAMVHRYRGALPGSRVELYAEICEVLLERWRQIRRIQDTLRLKASQKLVVLRSLAAHMMERRIRDISTEEALAQISAPLELVGATAIDGFSFLKDLQASSGLLLERESDQWSFAHLTFQEYLTSVHWLEDKNFSRDWRPFVAETWWHETLRLYAAQANATSLARTCLNENTIPALSLASDFLDESRELDPTTRREVEDILIAGLVSTNPARRRLAAEVQLSRRVRSLQRIDDQRAIDSSYITCAEYQLFLDSMQVRDKYFQPAHWEDLSFHIDEALKPIAGVEPQDAVVFCGWLTQRCGGTAHYRLPFDAEARSYPAVPAALATWCKDSDKYSLVGLDEKNKSTVVSGLTKITSLPPPHSLAPHPVFGSNRAAELRLELHTNLKAAKEHAKSVNISRSREVANSSLSANQLSRLIQHLLSKKFLACLFRIRDLAVDLVLNLDGSLGLEAFNALSDNNREFLQRSETRSVARSSLLEDDLNQVHELIRYRDLDLGFAADLSADVISDVDCALQITEDLELALLKELRCEVIVTLAIELIDIVTLDLALCHIIQAIDNHDQAKVQQIAQRLIPSLDDSTNDNKQPVHEMLNTIWRPEAIARLKMRKSWSRTLEYTYLSYQDINENAIGLNWHHWLLPRSQQNGRESRQDKLLDYCWWLKIICARQEGMLQCWEGIRTIREEIELVTR